MHLFDYETSINCIYFNYFLLFNRFYLNINQIYIQNLANSGQLSIRYYIQNGPY